MLPVYDDDAKKARGTGWRAGRKAVMDLEVTLRGYGLSLKSAAVIVALSGFLVLLVGGMLLGRGGSSSGTRAARGVPRPGAMTAEEREKWSESALAKSQAAYSRLKETGLEKAMKKVDPSLEVLLNPFDGKVGRAVKERVQSDKQRVAVLQQAKKVFGEKEGAERFRHLGALGLNLQMIIDGQIEAAKGSVGKGGLLSDAAAGGAAGLGRDDNRDGGVGEGEGEGGANGEGNSDVDSAEAAKSQEQRLAEARAELDKFLPFGSRKMAAKHQQQKQQQQQQQQQGDGSGVGTTPKFDRRGRSPKDSRAINEMMRQKFLSKTLAQVGIDAGAAARAAEVPVVVDQDPSRRAGGGGGGRQGLGGDEGERDDRSEERAAAVRDAFRHAWAGYERHAFGHDEIRPITNATNDSWGGWGVTLVDALDTMIIMGLDAEFARAREHVASINFDKDYSASFFETTIRYLGSLLSAYDLSGDELFLSKAIEVGDRLLPAFDSPTGIPYHEVNMHTGEAKNPSWARKASILSELGSVQLEFLFLSKASGNPIYAQKINKLMEAIAAVETPLPGLFPTYISPDTGQRANTHVSLGGLGDSFYEYLLKMSLLNGDKLSRRLYDEAVEGLKKNLLFESTPHKMLYIAEWEEGRVIPDFDHLVCYVPGMLALGAAKSRTGDEDLVLAEELVNTCYRLYRDQKSGIGPESVKFDSQTDDYTIASPRYLLRPETVESIFVLWRVTGNVKYREWAWQIFQAIEESCRVPSGYSGLLDVNVVEGSDKEVFNNSQQSFFFAETLKYLYLTFKPTSVLPLSEVVFTTEAHPLSMFSRSRQ